MDNGLQRNEWVMMERFLKDVPVKEVSTPSALLEWFLDNEMTLPEAVFKKHKWLIDRLKIKCGFWVSIEEGKTRSYKKKKEAMASQLRNRARQIILDAQIPAM